MTGTIVYADLSFFINFIMDFVILWSTAKIAGIKLRYERIIMASFLGAIYAVLYLYHPHSYFYSLSFKLLFSLVLLVIGLWPLNYQDFKKSLLYFYALSFMAAGAVMALSYCSDNSLSDSDFSFFMLLGGMVFIVFLGLKAEKYFSYHVIPQILKYKVELRFADKVCQGDGFLDTGNGLHDPLTSKPVMVAEYDLLKDCLPDDFKSLIENCSDENQRLNGLADCSMAQRLRIIPFSSIGKKNGILIGLRCDEAIVKAKKNDLLIKNMVVGIYHEKLSADGDYQLLIPSDVLQKL